MTNRQTAYIDLSLSSLSVTFHGTPYQTVSNFSSKCLRRILMHKRRASSYPKVASNSEIKTFISFHKKKKVKKIAASLKAWDMSHLNVKSTGKSKIFQSNLSKRGKIILAPIESTNQTQTSNGVARQWQRKPRSVNAIAPRKTNPGHKGRHFDDSRGLKGGNFHDSQATTRSRRNDESSSKRLAFWEGNRSKPTP